MKQSIVIKDSIVMLIFMIVFVSMVSLILACSISSRKAWYKPSSTKEEFTRDRYECLQQSQRGNTTKEGINLTGPFCLDSYCENDQIERMVEAIMDHRLNPYNVVEEVVNKWLPAMK